MSSRREPERTCAGCRARDVKGALVRVARSREGVRVDPGGSALGRGAYVHARGSCAESALRSGALGRALRTVLSPDEADSLRKEIGRIAEQ